MTSRLLPALAAVAVFLSGCLVEDGSSQGSGSSQRHVEAVAGSMTGTERASETVGVCPNVSPRTYCATKTYDLSGQVDLPYLPIEFSVFNGAASLKASSGDSWDATVVLTARGSSQAAAKDRLNDILFSWGHGDADGHLLRIEAQPKGRDASGLSASLQAELPTGIPLAGSAATSNAAATLQGFKIKGFTLSTSNAKAEVTGSTVEDLVVSTSNARIAVDAKGRDIRLSTSNGGIDATLTPTADGEFDLSTSNADVELRLPEDKTRGYDVSASTSNGDATIGLHDGTTSSGKTSREFKTSNYSQRSIRTQVSAHTSNADVEVDPA